MEIDLKVLAEKVKLVLDTAHLNYNVRYRSVCFMSDDISVTEGLKNSFYIELSSYERWLAPGQGKAPPYGTFRNEFEKRILIETSKGLLIYRPEDWISNWPKIDQAAFWSFVSMLHGQREIVLITSMSARGDIKRYMNKFSIEGTDVSYWLSNKASKQGSF
jgi:hypothetical protein